MSTHPLPKAEVGSDEGERNGHTEPESQQCHQRGEGHGRGAALAPQDQIHGEEQGEHHSEDITHAYC